MFGGVLLWSIFQMYCKIPCLDAWWEYTLVSAYIQTQRTSFVHLTSVSASQPITPKEKVHSLRIGVSRTIPILHCTQYNKQQLQGMTWFSKEQ